MTSSAFRNTLLIVLLLGVHTAHAEYRRIKLRVYGLDCGLCARGVSASIGRMAGVQSADVSLKDGILDIVLAPGNTFKLDDLRKRIRLNGFEPKAATITAVGNFNATGFEVNGAGESYKLARPASQTDGPLELTFDVP